MTLVVDELFDGIEFCQNFRINRSMNIAHIRPWMVKWGTIADGELVLQVEQNDELLIESTIDASVINSEITSTYFHGQIRFDFDSLQLNHDREAEYTEYTVKVFMRNHTTDPNNFMGTIRRYELKFYDTYGDQVENNEAPNDMVEPLGFELFEWE